MSFRRDLLAAGAALLTTTLAAPVLAATRTMPRMTDGPFYPPARWRAERGDDWDADLTQRSGAGPASGEHLGLSLRLVDTDGRAIDGADVEIWQCDALATYHHPDVRLAPGRHDPHFQGFGAAATDREGAVRMRTIRPIPYPGRTPHIHVKLRHVNFGELSSQLFVDGDPGNARDFLWRRLDAAGQQALAMQLVPAEGAARDAGLRWQVTHTLVLPA